MPHTSEAAIRQVSLVVRHKLLYTVLHCTMKQLFLLAVVCTASLALPPRPPGLPVSVASCPKFVDTELNLQDTSQVRTPPVPAGSSASAAAESPQAAFQRADDCRKPEVPNDDHQKDIARAFRPHTFGLSTCEPCPPQVHYLSQFYGNCYVLSPRIQPIRYVTCLATCKSPCNQPCNSVRSYCQRTQLAKIWFRSFCWGRGRLPVGYRFGYNYRYLWLPQDCTCRIFR